LVFQTAGIEPEEMRGFSIGESPMPAVVVNRADASAARVFTLLHELTHIALHTAGLCNLSELGPQSVDARRLETYCNHVAGAVLVPSQARFCPEVG
jgi:Zn-dependent peptidase ImmA (M78 family)